jgi:hypothetical protein
MADILAGFWWVVASVLRPRQSQESAIAKVCAKTTRNFGLVLVLVLGLSGSIESQILTWTHGKAEDENEQRIFATGWHGEAAGGRFFHIELQRGGGL